MFGVPLVVALVVLFVAAVVIEQVASPGSVFVGVMPVVPPEPSVTVAGNQRSRSWIIWAVGTAVSVEATQRWRMRISLPAAPGIKIKSCAAATRTLSKVTR